MAVGRLKKDRITTSGNTAARPSNPEIGDTHYNGQLTLLEIYNGTNWVPSSAPAGIPSVAGTDVGTGRAYASGAIDLTFTAGINGGSPDGYIGNAVLGANTYTTGSQISTTTTLNVGNPGTYSVSATGYNGFGSSPASVPINLSVTTVPENPTIGTATTSNVTTDVTVTWTLGNSGGKNLSSITITPYLNGVTAGTAQNAATTSSTTHAFTGLTGGSAYTFKVKATNANGVGLESSATNSITVPNLFNVEYLVLGGGGSGGSPGGGGGAGGYRTGTSGVLLSTNYACSVGSGGAGVASSIGNKGTGSSFGSINTSGGGRGANGGATGGNGGSGGGGPRDGASGGGTGNEGGYSPVEGYNGGSTSPMPYGGGAGGGGAGAAGVGGVGGTASTEQGGAGGNGAASSITGTSVTRGGGGGGGSEQPSSIGGGAGGSGGGGAGAKASNNATSGTANLGGGGGGTGTGTTSGAGGSGVVILRYLTADGTITIGAGLTGSTATDGSYKVTTITAGSGNVSWA